MKNVNGYNDYGYNSAYDKVSNSSSAKNKEFYFKNDIKVDSIYKPNNYNASSKAKKSAQDISTIIKAASVLMATVVLGTVADVTPSTDYNVEIVELIGYNHEVFYSVSVDGESKDLKVELTNYFTSREDSFSGDFYQGYFSDLKPDMTCYCTELVDKNKRTI